MAKKNSNKKNKSKISNPKAEEATTATSKKAPKQPKNLSTSNNYAWLGWCFAALAAALYLNTLGHQYAFDDTIVITGNSFTLDGFAGIYDLMTRDFFEGIYGPQGMDLTGGRYRPLSLVMFAIEEQLFPGNPKIGHFVNILLYALTGMLLFKVLKNWLDKTEGAVVIAFITTLLFITHPIHTEAVANIKSRDEVLAFLLILVSLHGIYKYTREENKNWFKIAVGSFFLAMLSKENAFTFIALIPLSLFVLQKMSLDKAIKISVPFFVAAAAYLALRTGMLYKPLPPGVEVALENPDIMENPFVNAPKATELATIGVILLHYVMLLFVPHPMSSDYSFNQIPWATFADPMALLGWAFYLGIGIYAAIRIWKKDIVALGILFYLAPLSLVCNLFFNIGAPMADRFLYVPSLGFCLIVGYLIVKFAKIQNFAQLKKNFLVMGSLVIITVLFSGKTIARNPDWFNNETLFTKDIHAAPNSAKIHYYYANTLLKKYLDPVLNDLKNPSPQALVWLDSAAAGFMRSYKINPKFHHATYNLGLVNIHKKNPQEALKWFNYTLELQPKHGMSHEQLVRVYGEFLNQPDLALKHLNIVLSTPEGQAHASNYQHLGILNAMKGNTAAAEAAFLQSTKDPAVAKGSYNNLAGMYGELARVANANGEAQKAAEYTQKAQAYAQKAAAAQ